MGKETKIKEVSIWFAYASRPMGSGGSSSSTTLPVNRQRKRWGRRAQITRRQAEMMRDELVRPLNESPFRSLGDDTFEKFVEDVFLPMKRESGEWRENTEKESTREIRLHLVSELGDVQFEELTPALLRAVLKKKAEQGLRRQTLNHLKGYLTDICKRATAEGYLETNVSEGLRAPFKLAKPADAKANRRTGGVCRSMETAR